MPLAWLRMPLDMALSILRCSSVLASITALTVYGRDSLCVFIVISPISRRFSADLLVEVNSTLVGNDKI